MRPFEKGKVSILTPCYNGERFLDRYFDSICKQTYDKVELIIVNDGSTDNSEKVCLSWKRNIEERGYVFRYISQKPNKGAAAAINCGLPYVTGEFLIWPDCDDTLMPTSIEKRVEFLDQNPYYSMVRSDFISVYEEKPDVIVGRGSDFLDVKKEDIFGNLIFEKTYCACGCYMARSSVLFERIPAGGIWESRGGQNWQLLLPSAYKNKTGYINEPLYKYFIHEDSHSHRVVGDKYSTEKNKTFRLHDILFHVLKDFSLMTEDEKTQYLAQIKLRYILMRLDLALLYNMYDDVKTELHALAYMNANPGIHRKILCRLCRFGVSGYIIKCYSLCILIPRAFRIRVLSVFKR